MFQCFSRLDPPLSADLMITSFIWLSSLRALISSCDKLPLLVVGCWYKSVISLRKCLKYFCKGGKMYSVGSVGVRAGSPLTRSVVER